MAGRYFLVATPEEIERRFGCGPVEAFPPRYNIAPGQPILVVLAERGRIVGRLVRWGLTPSWAKDPRRFGPFVNARGEDVAEKPAFRGAMRHRRCLVPASGYYHWQKAGGGPPQPWAIRPEGGGLAAFAGLWDPWLGADGSEVDGAAVVTVPAAEGIAGIADRMPAILEPGAYARWLAVDRVSAGAAALLLRPSSGPLVAIPVGSRVNRVENDGPSLLAGAGSAPAGGPAGA